ncbi:MAG TPA: PAS domain S-box protein [Methanoregulaceae archaeon]|nr:PAS domain S-box protein [Methanoregulaceae archaeon]HPD75121.1 PAS domain S-box protein [Methanoregulaceae archaeon]
MHDRIRVLYVDDEPGLLEIGKIFLEGTPEFQVDTLISAQKALSGNAITGCEAIVSDYMMPEMDGIAFLKAVRKQFGDLPFILFTGKGREEVVIEAINNGADFYLQKGGDPRSQFAELAHKIRQAVARRRADFLRIKTEQDLRESEEKFRSLIDLTPIGIMVQETAGRILYVNREGLRLAGAESVEDFRGKDALTYIHPDDRPLVQQHARQRETETAAIPMEMRLLTLDGRPYPVEIRSKPIHFGGLPAIMLLFQDLTSRKRAEDELRAAYEQIAASEEELRSNLDEIMHAQKEREKSERNFQTLVDSAPYAIYTHLNGRFLYLNRAALRLFGVASTDQMVGTNVWDRIHPLFHGIVRERVKRLTVDREPVGHYDEVYVRLDGSPFDVEVTAVPYQYEGQDGTLVMFQDIMERKKREGELLAKVEELTADRRTI